MYESPVLSKIPGGYNARQVDLTYINNDRAFREALLKPTTTFFVPEFYVFACTLEDKRKLVAWLKSEGTQYTNLIVFWPGKYQSHAFSVRRRRGVTITRIMELLEPGKDDIARIEREANLKQIKLLREKLSATSMELRRLERDIASKMEPAVAYCNDINNDDDWDGYR